MKNNAKLTIGIIIILVGLLVLGFILANALMKPDELSYRTLFEKIQNEEVESIEVDGDVVTVKLKNNKDEYRVYQNGELHSDLISKLGDQIDEWPFDYSKNDRNAGNFWQYIFTGLMFAVVIIIAISMVRGLGGGKQIINFSRSGAHAHSTTKIRFTDVAGAEEEKEELREIVEFLKTPGKFAAAGARIPRGVLLVGPPGTGKTLFAKAVAGEANVPFFSISGSDFVEMYVGVGASRVRDLFDVAKKNKPCIIFIDEIDAVGRQRGAGLGGGHDEREQTLNQLLVQMDGFETGDDIIVMAATNRSDILDPALMRPGRFDRQIYVNYPDVRGREAIFKVHSRNKQLSANIDFQVLARMTSGFTGADIANLLNEAAILAARNNRVVIEMVDIYEGINKVELGPQKKSRLVTEFDKRITAYHEAGHAIVAKCSPRSDTVHEVSIIPRGSAAGYTAMRPDDDNSHITLGRIEAQLAVFMGGRAAEEIVIKDITSGAVGDIKHVTGVARRMVTEWGMSSLGPIFYGSSQEVFLGRDYGSSHDYSEEIAARIDKEVERIIETAHKTALELLIENRSKMEVMARVLIECETIYADEVDMIMEGKTDSEVLFAVRQKREMKSEKNNPSAGV